MAVCQMRMINNKKTTLDK